MAITFDRFTHFWIALVKHFRMIYNLPGFWDVRIFPFFGNDIIMTSFLVTWFPKFAYFAVFIKGYQLPKFQYCRLSGSSFTEGIKHNDDVIMTSIYTFGILNFHSVKLDISYQPAKFQIPQLSESTFTEVFKRHPITIMTSL